MTQVVKHKSRILTEDFQFSANGETSWSFVAEGDGEIFFVESNNIASYTINGSAPSLPYSLANGQSYTVAITKTTGGQVADIQLKIRRAIDKDIVTNVPDFAAGDGRYLYVLFETANEVKKIDTGLLTTANYAGAGSWTIDPVVSTIALPTLPNGATYQTITFVKNDGQNRMIVLGGEQTYNVIYASYIKSDDTVTDMDDLTVTPYTQIRNRPTLLRALNKACIYDFINEYLFITTSGSNGTTAEIYDLVNKVIIGESNLSSPATKVSPNSTIRAAQLIPANGRFTYLADAQLWTLPEKYFNYKPGQNAGTVSSYISSLGYTERNNGNIKTKRMYDSFGCEQAQFAAGNSPIGGAPTQQFGANEVITLDSIGAIFTIFRQSYSIVNYKGGNGTSSDVVDFEVGASWLKSVMGSNYSGQYYALSTNTTSKRLFVFDLAEDPHMFGYLEFANDASQMHTNQLII